MAFSLTGIPAEAAGADGVIARDRAFAGARRLAWQRVVAMLGAAVPEATDRQIEEMTASLVIEDERTGPHRYRGRVTVNLDPERVRAFLAGYTGATPCEGGAREPGRSAPPGFVSAPPGFVSAPPGLPAGEGARGSAPRPPPSRGSEERAWRRP